MGATHSRIISGARRTSRGTDHQTDVCADVIVLPTEIDNHADTICAGKNCRIEYYTPYECSVSPFLEEYQDQQNVRICTALTAATIPSTGETVLLRLGQCLDFHDKMNKTLLNPNQLRAFGISICDDPTDEHRSLGIQLDPNTHLPLYMNGSICGLMTWSPTNEELESCRIFDISDVNDWNPTNVVFAGNNNNNRYSHINATSSRISHLSDAHPVCVDCILPSFELLCVSSTVTTDRHHAPDARLLSEKWECSVEVAKATLQSTTQLNIRSAVAPLTRRYRTDLLSMNLRRLNCKFFTDTLFSNSVSIVGNSCAQLYYDPNGFMYVYPMSSKREAGESLDQFVNDVGIPNQLVYDGAGEQVGRRSQFDKSVRHYKINNHLIEPFSPWQNRAESGIRIIKAKWRRLMIKRKVPKRLWDFALVWVAQIYSRTAMKHGRTGFEMITGDTPDISEWVDFSFYDWVWYWHSPNSEDNPRLGRWIGVSHRVGSALCYWILPASGRVLARTTVQHVTIEEMATDDTKQKMEEFNHTLSRVVGDDSCVFDGDGFYNFVNSDLPDPYDLSADDPNRLPDIDEVVDQADAEKAADTYHSFVGAEVIVPDASGNRRMAKVLRRVRDAMTTDETPTNVFNDRSVFEVQFPDGTVDRLGANVIAENIFSQIDENGRQFQILREIVEHQKDASAITIDNGYVTSRSGNRHLKKTTRGWKLLVEWMDGSVSWIPLKDLKASNPVQLAEYAIANNIDNEPAFKWWVHHTIKVRDRIIGKVQTRYWRTTHKFGIRLPKTVEEAYRIDEETGTTFWRDAIEKELKKVRVAFEKLNISVYEMRSGQARPGYQEIKYHWVFDIKMDGNFTRKARLVAGGHTTDTPVAMTYSSVVSRDSIRIAFLLAALNDLKICAADVGNAYLNAPCKEKIWTVAGLEFGSEVGSVMIIVRALYGLKSSGASWASMLNESIMALGYSPSEADRNVWLKPGVKPDGFRYYQMILIYVDDILHLSHDPDVAINALRGMYELKEGSVGPPTRYLGANVERVQLSDGRETWAMSSKDYITSAISNVESLRKMDGEPPLKVYGDCKRPYPKDYRPEIDASDELDDQGIHWFQELIGILRWAVELGRVDIMTEVSCLSQHLCAPRVGHLDAAYMIFRYLQRNLSKNTGRIAFDPMIPPCVDGAIGPDDVAMEHWREFYPNASDPLPPNMPEPLGNPVVVAAYVDANHAGNLANRRSHTGVLLYVNNSLIVWYSKRQNTVESSSFGSEFVALRIATELNEALRYKLRMFGVPVEGPTTVYCDNKSVVTNATIPTSVLSKRHNAICYHKVREAQAAGIIHVLWIKGTNNLADLLTKTTLASNVKHDIADCIFANKSVLIEDGA